MLFLLLLSLSTYRRSNIYFSIHIYIYIIHLYVYKYVYKYVHEDKETLEEVGLDHDCLHSGACSGLPAKSSCSSADSPSSSSTS